MNDMKKNNGRKYRAAVLMIVFLVMVSVSSFPAKYEKPRFYIKFKGIGSLADGGHYNDFVERSDIHFNGLNEEPGYTVLVTTPPYFRGYSGEIGFETRRYAVGISAGYIEKNFRLDYHYADPDTGYVEDYTRDHTFSAVPLFLFIHYKIINTSFLKGYFTLGEGVYLATYKDNLVQTFENGDLTFANGFVKGKKNHLGFHAGVTFDLTIFRNLALFLEAGYRFVRFKEIEADDFYENDNVQSASEGILYYKTNDRTGETRLSIGESGDFFWEELPAVLDLNGFSFSVGIKIIFGGKKKPKPVKVAPID